MEQIIERMKEDKEWTVEANRRHGETDGKKYAQANQDNLNGVFDILRRWGLEPMRFFDGLEILEDKLRNFELEPGNDFDREAYLIGWLQGMQEVHTAAA